MMQEYTQRPHIWMIIKIVKDMQLLKVFLNQSSQTASNQEFIWEKIVSLKRAKHRIGEKRK